MSTFRTVYRQLTEFEKNLIDSIKRDAELLEAQFNQVQPGGRELALARTKLEEAVMWAVKGITG